jgi:hypothetical protein
MPKINHSQKLKLFEFAKEDFSVFMEAIILPYDQPNQEFHNTLDRDLAEAIKGTNIGKSFAVITMPRDHGKSKHLSIGFPLWLMARDHNVRILAVSRTAGVAETFLSEIVSHIERNPLYIEFCRHIDPTGKGVVPRQKPGRSQTEDWSGKSITIEREDNGLKDPTLIATGVFGQILSRRADVVIGDDIVDQQNSMTESQRHKVRDWLETTVIPVLVPGGAFVYLGNTWHMDDVVSRYLQDPRFAIARRVGAIIHDSARQDLWLEWARLRANIMVPKKTRDENAARFYAENRVEMDRDVQVLWPDRYPYSELFFMRYLNPYVFARMYQCDPSNRPDQKIREEWIQAALAKGKALRFQDMPHPKNHLFVSAAGMDLAISQEEFADDTSLNYVDVVQYGYDGIANGDYIVRQIHRGHFTPAQQRALAKNAWKDHGMLSVRVESNSYQAALSIDLQDDGVPITSYHTGKEKFDPDVGINIIANLMEHGQLVIPSDPEDPRTAELANKLANEMRAYTGDNTEHTGDSLMALWFAISEVREKMGTRILVAQGNQAAAQTTPVKLTQEQIKEGEKKADRAATLEKEAERAEYRRLMRARMVNNWRR